MKTPGKPASTAKAAVVLLSGFLGAGKTTLLRKILSWAEDLSGTVVMVNEFGDVGIDGSLLKDSGSDVVELTSGCICCTLSNDMLRSLSGLLDSYHPKRIIIEASGVADPSAIASVLEEPALKARLQLDKIVTVLDADFWEAREAFGPLFYNQLEMAHLILLNKVDLVASDCIPRYLKELHDTIPGCRVVPTVQCRVDPGTLWSEGKKSLVDLKPMAFYQPHFHEETRSGSAPDHGLHPVDASRFITFSYRTRLPLNESAFRAFVDALPFDVFRMKGPVRLPDRTVMINHVGGHTEWRPWANTEETQLAFIGWNITKEPYIARLDACAAS